MGEFGLRIKNIKAGSLYGYNCGVRDRYDYTDAMFNKSLFYYFMLDHGLKTYKDEFTRDIICIDFSFGARSYEEESKHLHEMLKDKADDPEATQRIEYLIQRAEENKYKYDKKSKDELRFLFYKEGVSVEYTRIDKKTKEPIKERIHYKMLYRNPSKAKTGQAMFINESLYDVAHEWLTMGIDRLMPVDNAMIVELSAYSTLVTSGTIGSFHMNVEDVLILRDQDSFFRTIADVVKSADYETTERVIDQEKTEKNRNAAIKAGKLDLYGEPIYKIAYKKTPCVKKRCIVEREETDVKNVMWDGMALIETSACPSYCNGMALLRNHFFKACAFRTRIQKFFQDYCAEHGIDYETYEIEDMFGQKHLAKNIQMITTDNAIKWKKFAKYLGGDLPSAYQYWKKRVIKDGNVWGVVKTEHRSKLGDGNIQQMSYQMVNTLPCTSEDVYKIAKTSIDYVELIKKDNDEFEKFLRKNATAINHYEMLADLYAWNHEFAKSRLFRIDKSKIISQYVHRLRKGKITVEGDNLTVCGNPYALLLYSVGEDWEADPTLRPEPGVIQCYTTRFENGEYLCGIRSPQNSANNVAYLKNTIHPLMDKYFCFSNNIMAVNCIHSDVQARMNGEDFDSDFNFVTNQPEMVRAAKKCYADYPTVVNALEESGLTYRNIPEEYARMDSAMAAAQKAIGGSSDSAQLCQSYYWSKLAKNEHDFETIELYQNIIILAVLAQVAIDGCKKTFAVDANAEIERIRAMDCMNRLYPVSDGIKTKTVKRDLPLFWQYTHEIPVTKNNRERPPEDVKKERNRLKTRIDNSIICPMNWLQEWLDKIQGLDRGSSVSVIETFDFFVKAEGTTANNRQMTEIRRIIEEYDAFVKSNTAFNDSEDSMSAIMAKTEEVTSRIAGMKISAYTVNRLIETSLGYLGRVNTDKIYKDSEKYVRKMLNVLYRTNKEKFLASFKRESYLSMQK